MSKELEALNDLRNKCCDYLSLSMDRQVCDSFKLIEAALKEKENIEKTINELFSENGKVITTIDIKKQLKAIEIIKDKEVNVFIFLHSGDLETYNDMVEENRKLTQEEYDLLKEVLL